MIHCQDCMFWERCAADDPSHGTDGFGCCRLITTVPDELNVPEQVLAIVEAGQYGSGGGALLTRAGFSCRAAQRPPEYPDGQISSDDRGATQIRMAVKDGVLLVAFEQPTEWIGLDYESAKRLGNALLLRAEEIRK